MNFLIIGNGFIAPRHIEAIHTVGGKVVEVIDTRHGENAWRRAVKNSTAEGVVILTPNDLHFEMAMTATQYGKIVLCEKPLVIDLSHGALLSNRSVFTVLQLRYHPSVEKIKSRLALSRGNLHTIYMDILVYRDEGYARGWKGDAKRSGGILFNLGIHYFDLLLYLFGEPTYLSLKKLDDKNGEGIIRGPRYTCFFRVSTGAERENQRRTFVIDGENYNFSSKDNLSYENLHFPIYQDLLKKKGITPLEAMRSIRLVRNLYQSFYKE